MAARRNRDQWLEEMYAATHNVKLEVNSNRGGAKDIALADFLKLNLIIDEKSDKLEREADDFIKEAKEYVERLASQDLDLPEDYPYPDPAELTCRPFYLRRPKESDYDPPIVRVSKETLLESLSIGNLSVETPTSSTEATRDFHDELHSVPETASLHSEGRISNTPAMITHSVLNVLSMHGARDIVSSGGLSLIAARNALFIKQENETLVNKDILCWSVCFSSSSEFLVVSGEWGNNKVRRFELPSEGQSNLTEVEGYEVKGALTLIGISCSLGGLVAVCDRGLKRITIHTLSPWYRIDTVDCNALYGETLFYPWKLTWLDEDHLCVKLTNDETIHCVSLRYKAVIWSQDFVGVRLLSSAFNRVYVSHYSWTMKGNTFTVLRGDTGEVLAEEQISCPEGEALKVFPNLGGEGLITYSYKEE